MFFVFVDESGNPGQGNEGKASKHFTLAGLVVQGDNLLQLENKLKLLKDHVGLDPSVEFKWNSSYSKFGLSFENYYTYRETMFGLIAELAETVVASVINKNEAFEKKYIKNQDDLYKQALMLLMERINYWLKDNNPQPTVFVIDSRMSSKNRSLDERLSAAYKNALRAGTFYTNFKWFSETPFFASSKGTPGLQVADYCAGPIQQYYEKGKADWLRMLHPKIRRSPWDHNKIIGYGIKKFP